MYRKVIFLGRDENILTFQTLKNILQNFSSLPKKMTSLYISTLFDNNFSYYFYES